MLQYVVGRFFHFLYSKLCDRPMSCDEVRRPVVEFMCESIVFCSTCTMGGGLYVSQKLKF